MAKPELKPVTLGAKTRLAIEEILEKLIPRLTENINDKDTTLKEREISLKIKFKPVDSDRRAIEVSTSSDLKLAGINKHTSRLYIGKSTDGKPLLFDEDPRQETLFEPPVTESNVMRFGTK